MLLHHFRSYLGDSLSRRLGADPSLQLDDINRMGLRVACDSSLSVFGRRCAVGVRARRTYVRAPIANAARESGGSVILLHVWLGLALRSFDPSCSFEEANCAMYQCSAIADVRIFRLLSFHSYPWTDAHLEAQGIYTGPR